MPLNLGLPRFRTKRVLEKTGKIFLVFSVLVLVSYPRTVEATVDTSREDRLLKDALEYIDTNRKGTTQIELIDDVTGKPAAGAEVQYQQMSHDFIFSTNFWGDPGKMQWLGLEWSGDVSLSWSEIQQAKGVYDYSKPDRTISWLRQNPRVRLWGRFTSLLIDWNHPESPRPPSFADIDHIGDPAVFAQYKDLVYDFVFNVTTHYKGIIPAYRTQIEINWPDDAVTLGFSTRRLWTVEQAVELNKAVTNAIRDAYPAAIIMLGTSTASGGSSGHGIDALQFARLCLESGVDVDMLALEAYPFDGGPAFFYDYVKTLAKLGKPVFIHETGYPSPIPVGTSSAVATWMRTWKWNEFNEHAQALWYKYMFTLTFGMKEVTGVSLLCIRDAEPYSLYSTTVSPIFDTVGLYTEKWQPKESVTMLRELMANFTTSGVARTDDNGVFSLRGFAGDYRIEVKGYKPISDMIHVSEGKLENVAVRVVREKTPEYDDAAAIVASAQSALLKLNASSFKSSEARDLAQQAATECSLAVAALNEWELDAARTHAARSEQLAEQALQTEAEYQEQQKPQEQQQQDYLSLSVVLAAIVAIVVVMVVLLVRRRGKGRK